MTSAVPDLMATPEPEPPPTSINILADPALPKFEVAKVHAALSHPVRYRAIEMMAHGDGLSVTQLAEATGIKFDMASKHLRVLRAAGIVQGYAHPDDARCWHHTIAKEHRRVPGVVDYGTCVLRFEKKEKV